MRIQHQRSDVLPLMWEVPAAVVLAWLMTAVLALPFGQALAYVVTGRSFVWPTDLVASMSRLLGGTPGLGVDIAPPTGGLVYRLRRGDRARDGDPRSRGACLVVADRWSGRTVRRRQPDRGAPRARSCCTQQARLDDPTGSASSER